MDPCPGGAVDLDLVAAAHRLERRSLLVPRAVGDPCCRLARFGWACFPRLGKVEPEPPAPCLHLTIDGPAAHRTRLEGALSGLSDSREHRAHRLGCDVPDRERQQANE